VKRKKFSAHQLVTAMVLTATVSMTTACGSMKSVKALSRDNIDKYNQTILDICNLKSEQLEGKVDSNLIKKIESLKEEKKSIDTIETEYVSKSKFFKLFMDKLGEEVVQRYSQLHPEYSSQFEVDELDEGTDSSVTQSETEAQTVAESVTQTQQESESVTQPETEAEQSTDSMDSEAEVDDSYTDEETEEETQATASGATEAPSEYIFDYELPEYRSDVDYGFARAAGDEFVNECITFDEYGSAQFDTQKALELIAKDTGKYGLSYDGSNLAFDTSNIDPDTHGKEIPIFDGSINILAVETRYDITEFKDIKDFSYYDDKSFEVELEDPDTNNYLNVSGYIDSKDKVHINNGLDDLCRPNEVQFCVRSSQ